MHVTLVSFGTPEYDGSLAALRHSALAGPGGADVVKLHAPTDVADFFAERPELLRQSRGHGWWAWKAVLVRRALDAAPDGGWVVYADAGTRFVSDVKAYAAAAPDGTDVVLFRLGEHAARDHSIAAWTSPRCLAAMGVAGDAALGATPMVNAAVQMYRAGPAARAFVDRYLAWCGTLDAVADPPSFPNHRHDQSILSVLAAQAAGGGQVAVWRDPTQYGVGDPVPPGAPAHLPPLLHHHRARLPLPPRVAVVTSATGHRCLPECLASVQAQTYPNVEHWVVADGPQFAARVAAAVAPLRGRMPVVHLALPRNTGGGGWNGHRVYAAASHLVDAPLVAFLDEDNAFEPDHIERLVECLARADGGAAWAFSLRSIVDQAGARVCDDTCESLGGLCHTPAGPGDHLVDTNCYLLPRELAAELSGCWNARARAADRPEVDRALAGALLAGWPWACSRAHTVRYRAGSGPASVRPEFFLAHDQGWDFARKKDVYVFHFGAEQTARYFAARRKRDRCYAFDEWQMTLWRGLDATHNVLNGFANMAAIPRGAVCLVALCQPSQLPLDWLAERDDLHRVCYTLESPNIRHQAQWDAAWLSRHFDRVLTYWTPLLSDFRVPATYCPHNTHHLDLALPLDAGALRANAGVGRSVCIVLERRDLAGSYSINGVPLRCLDSLRETYVDGLKNVTVYGQGWDRSRAVLEGRAVLGHARHRSQDPQSSVDIMRGYVFALVVENCDAEGYASEKLYDAMVAGCIPLYYGSAPAFVPADMYVDLKRFADGAAVQRFLDSLTCEQVAAWRRRVLDGRAEVLAHVSVQAFAECVRGALAADAK